MACMWLLLTASVQSSQVCMYRETALEIVEHNQMQGTSTEAGVAQLRVAA